MPVAIHVYNVQVHLQINALNVKIVHIFMKINAFRIVRKAILTIREIMNAPNATNVTVWNAKTNRRANVHVVRTKLKNLELL
jgi:hypothetical protein